MHKPLQPQPPKDPKASRPAASQFFMRDAYVDFALLHEEVLKFEDLCSELRPSPPKLGASQVLAAEPAAGHVRALVIQVYVIVNGHRSLCIMATIE